MTALRIGTLGAARITPAALIVPASARSDVEVTAVAARDRGDAEAFASRRSVPRVLDGYEALVTDPDVDAVYVPLPNSHHAQWTVAALEAGKHVLCEKPFASNAEEARQVAAVADAHPDQVVMEAFHWRYHPLAQRAIDLIGSGDLGEVRHIETTMCVPLVLARDIRWQLDLAGGAMMDVGCYAVSMLRHFAGAEPTVRSARAWERSPGVDRRVEADLDFEDGRTGRVTTSMLSRTLLWTSAKIEGTHGSVRVLNPTAPQLFHRFTITVDGGKRTERFPRSTTSYGGQLDAFVRAVRGGEPVLTPPEDAVANMEVIDAIYRAAGMEPRPVRVS